MRALPPRHPHRMTTRPFRPTLFRSFWLGGFESSCHRTRNGQRLDMLEATQHDRFLDLDYSNLRTMGIATARDTVRWHLIEKVEGHYDFSSLDPYIDAARRHGIQVIWDLLHYGWPDRLDLFSAAFVERFGRFCGAVARYLRSHSDEPLFFTPVNELSFFAWAAGQVAWFYPYGEGRGGEVKRQLVRAWIAGVDAIRAAAPDARIVSVEPIIHNVPPQGKDDVGGRAAGQRESQWEAWDMIAGWRDQDLGGAASYLDIVGVNFYHDNQWEVPGGKKIAWHIHPRDPRWVPFHRLLTNTYLRYQRPILIGETSHVGVGRAEWIRELTDEVCVAIEGGVPLEGICLYPIIDRFEWEDPQHWHNSGLWDFDVQPDGTLTRVLNHPYAEELQKCQARVAALWHGAQSEHTARA
jgi:beta-glucosidase/6-phospho-beta-glucosidase/beta-galactosidase